MDHCRSCLVFLTGSLSALALVRIDSLGTELTRYLTSRVLDCLRDVPGRDNVEYILAKAKAEKLPVKKTKQERQWYTAAGVLNTNTKIATSFSLPELHANKLINQSLHVVDLNINRYDMIIGRDLIRSLGIDIHGTDITIHWDNAAIPWSNIDSTTNNVFVLSQHNAPFNSETKRMKCILNAKNTKSRY